MKVRVYIFETKKGQFGCVATEEIKALNCMISRGWFEMEDITDISFKYYEQN